MPNAQRHHPAMKPFPEPRTVFQANLHRLIRPNGSAISVNAWAKGRELDQTTINRLVNGQDPKLSMIEKIAAVCDLAPWQLLVPDMVPSNPPMLRGATPTEQSFYKKMAELAEKVEELRNLGNTRPGDL